MRKDDIEEAELERERQAQADREEEEEKEQKQKRERLAQEEEEKKEADEERRTHRSGDSEYGSSMDPDEYARRVAASERVQKGIAFALLGFGVAAIAGGLLCAVAALTGTGRYRE
jgi:hypothetical protein